MTPPGFFHKRADEVSGGAKESHSAVALSKQGGPEAPKHARPKIALFDLTRECATALSSAGYTVTVGSFGVPYVVPKSDQLAKVVLTALAPQDYTEQEIVVADLTAPPSVDSSQVVVTPSTETGFWAASNQGIINPRPCAMAHYQPAFDRILAHGGVFLIFATPRVPLQMYGTVETTNRLATLMNALGESLQSYEADNWCFLSALNRFELVIHADQGSEITPVGKGLLASILARDYGNTRFLCTFLPTSTAKNSWEPLAHNKFGAVVAIGAEIQDDDKTKPVGRIILLPQVGNKAQFLLEIIARFLPEVCPHLFPDFTGRRWVHQPEYELPKVVELSNQIEDIQAQALREVAALQGQIAAERAANAYYYNLLTGTGDELVKAVEQALKTIGFQSVVNVDEQIRKSGKQELKREDLQIGDRLPLLLVEVKGITGLPTESASLQVWKYVAPRMRELKSNDICGLSIINHQRNLPAKQRQNESPFGQDVLTNAEEQHFGLLTTWDLCRLVRSFLKNHWTHQQVSSLFYAAGRISPVPVHYEFLGTVHKFWEKVQVVEIGIENGKVAVGDCIAFELPHEFEEQPVESLHVDQQPAAKATSNMVATIKTHLTRNQLPKGTRVFLVKDAGDAAAV
jgi:hypothetical protein